MVRSRSWTGSTPANAPVMKMAESTPCPIKVEPMVRVHSQRPCVAIFSRAITNELRNSPAR